MEKRYMSIRRLRWISVIAPTVFVGAFEIVTRVLYGNLVPSWAHVVVALAAVSIAGGPGPLVTLLLATTGRRSGGSHTVPLIYGEADGNYVIVASRGGSKDHPDWYKNLAASPDVSLRVATDVFDAVARTAAGEEREALWQKMLGIFPPYDSYQERTERQIPVVVLAPVSA